VGPAPAAAEIGRVDPGHRIPVVVHAADPMSRAGALSQLRQHPVIDLRDEAEARPGTVAVLIGESPDETMLTRLRRLVRSEGARGTKRGTSCSRCRLKPPGQSRTALSRTDAGK
jgi:hypothetical protein